MKMTSLWRHVYIEHSQLVQYFARSLTTCQVLTPLRVMSILEKWIVQQWNLFKCQTSTSYFQHIVQIYSNIYWHMPVRPYERLDCCDRCISRQNNKLARSFLINNFFSSTSKLLTLNMYCWSCKTLVPIYWTHLGVNGILAKSFCPQKMNNRTLFLTGCFQQ